MAVGVVTEDTQNDYHNPCSHMHLGLKMAFVDEYYIYCVKDITIIFILIVAKATINFSLAGGRLLLLLK